VVDIDVAASGPSRLIPFEAVFNFRDLGGYPGADGRTVKWRLLFRADGLNRLRAWEADAFAALGVATVVDLRTAEEAETVGRFPLELGEVDYHHLPMFDVMPDWVAAGDPEAEGYLADRYLEMLSSGRDALAATLQLAGQPGSLPLVFHCAAGKDRTGIVAAVLLSLLGVPDDVIVADYALSTAAMGRLIAWARETMPVDPSAPPRAPVPQSVIDSEPSTMARFLELIRSRFGSADGLVRDLGLPDDLPVRIRQLLLG